MHAPVLSSQLRCPTCGHEELLVMSTDACLFFHACASCGVMLRPRAGDCCVFCSYGSVPCPPVQAADGSATQQSDALVARDGQRTEPYE